MKHTAGPWVLRADPDDNEAWIIVGNEHGHFRIADVCPRFKPKEELYNAKLLAAAPELAEALLGVLRVADRKTIEFDAARTALTKAGFQFDGKGK